MSHEFEVPREAEVDATLEQVWDAIATGPGIDSWFIGRNDVEPREGGAVRTNFGGFIPDSSVTAWDPPRRFAYRSAPSGDGRFVAYEFLVEGRGQGSTVLRAVTSGFLPGDDWEAEYEAMTLGGDLFFGTLVQHLTHFAGRAATPITAFGPPIADWDRAWTVLHGELGLTAPVAEGDAVRFAPEGVAPVEGSVYFVNRHNVGVRSGDALYRFLRGFHGPMVVSHHLYADHNDPRATESAWQSWLTRLFA
jgi:uncharacterized protein YndB with AHSA1/START domain